MSGSSLEAGAACELNPLFPGATCEAVEAPI